MCSPAGRRLLAWLQQLAVQHTPLSAAEAPLILPNGCLLLAYFKSHVTYPCCVTSMCHPKFPLAPEPTHSLTHSLIHQPTHPPGCVTRIRYYQKELVVFRYDLLKAVMRRCLVQPPGE